MHQGQYYYVTCCAIKTSKLRVSLNTSKEKAFCKQINFFNYCDVIIIIELANFDLNSKTGILKGCCNVLG